MGSAQAPYAGALAAEHLEGCGAGPGAGRRCSLNQSGPKLATMGAVRVSAASLAAGLALVLNTDLRGETGSQEDEELAGESVASSEIAARSWLAHRHRPGHGDTRVGVQFVEGSDTAASGGRSGSQGSPDRVFECETAAEGIHQALRLKGTPLYTTATATGAAAASGAGLIGQDLVDQIAPVFNVWGGPRCQVVEGVQI